MINRVLVAPINYDHPQLGLLQAFDGIFDSGAFDFGHGAGMSWQRSGRSAAVGLFDFIYHQRRGHPIEVINGDFVAAAAHADWIWLQAQDTEIIHAESLLRIRTQNPRCVISHWTGDMRPTVSDYMASICKASHLTLASSIGQLAAFRAAGAARAEYCQIGVDWFEDVIGLPAWEPPFRVPEVVFCGNFYGDRFPEGSAERLAAIRALVEAGFDVGVVGKGWPGDIPVAGECTVKQQHHVYRKAKVALSISHFANVASYYSDRQIIAMASGTPVVARWVPGMDEEFEFDPFNAGDPCVWYYGNPDDLVVEVKHLLCQPELAARIGRAGRREVIRRHTWFSRILGVLPLIEELQASL